MTKTNSQVFQDKQSKVPKPNLQIPEKNRRCPKLVEGDQNPGGGVLVTFDLRRLILRPLTNGHSKSLKHHKAMQALFIAWYNFGRKNEALKGATPAMASGLSDRVWTIKELIEKAAKA